MMNLHQLKLRFTACLVPTQLSF